MDMWIAFLQKETAEADKLAIINEAGEDKKLQSNIASPQLKINNGLTDDYSHSSSFFGRLLGSQ